MGYRPSLLIYCNLGAPHMFGAEDHGFVAAAYCYTQAINR